MKINSPFQTLFTSIIFFIVIFALPLIAWSEPVLSATLEYSNTETGLRFAYPADYVLKEFIAPDGKLIFILIGIKGKQPPRWLLDIGISDSGTYPSAVYGGERPTVSPRQFALEEARNHCTADGDDGGVRCEEAVRVNEFKTDSGVAGLEIYLREISTHYDEDGGETSKEAVKGPIYAFDISRGPSIKLIMAEPLFQAIESTDELATVKTIVDSFRIEPAQRQLDSR